MKDLYSEGSGQGSYTSKERVGYGKVTFLQVTAGSDRQVTSVVLTRKFLINQFKMPLLKIVIRLVIKSQSGDVGLRTTDSIQGPLSLTILIAQQHGKENQHTKIENTKIDQITDMNVNDKALQKDSGLKRGGNENIREIIKQTYQR